MNRNVTASILLVLAVGIYFTVTSGMIDSAREVKVINDQYTKAIDSASQLVAVRDEITAKYTAISASDRDRLDKMIPSTVDNIRLIIDLNNLGLKHGFTIQGIKATVPSNLSQSGGFAAPRAQVQQAPVAPGNLNLSAAQTSVAEPILDKVLVTFTVTAGYDQFISFLRDLESNLRITDLTRLTMATNDAGTYDFDVQLQTYWLRQ